MLLIWGPRLWWNSHYLSHVLLIVEAPEGGKKKKKKEEEAPEGEQKHTMPPKAPAGNYWPTVASSPIPFVQAGHMPKAKVNMATLYTLLARKTAWAGT